MHGDEWSDRLAARAAGRAPAEDARELEQHLADCLVCREELSGLADAWHALGALDAAVPSERMRLRFQQAGARPDTPRRVWHALVGPWPVLRAAMLALIVGGLGFAAGMSRSARPGPAPPVSHGRYVLLLRERPDAAPADAASAARTVAEYKAWARGWAERGKLVGGEKLADEGRLLAPAPSAPRVDDARALSESIGGYFIIAADSAEEALAIARTCPHLAHGGRIELRAVEPV